MRRKNHQGRQAERLYGYQPDVAYPETDGAVWCMRCRLVHGNQAHLGRGRQGWQGSCFLRDSPVCEGGWGMEQTH